VPLLMGTDSPTVLGVPGFSAVDEVQAMVNSGIPLSDALRIATWNGGQFISERLELEQPFGAIREGWRADLLLLGSNPLIDAANLEDIEGVMGLGRWRSNAWFEDRLEAIAQSYGN
jgi:imidazolonepropionase-like amidohydrolase